MTDRYVFRMTKHTLDIKHFYCKKFAKQSKTQDFFVKKVKCLIIEIL